MGPLLICSLSEVGVSIAQFIMRDFFERKHYGDNQGSERFEESTYMSRLIVFDFAALDRERLLLLQHVR
jgi:hypothetical protein